MKKTLSIILAMTLLISLAPSVFASGESTTEPELELAYNYDFGAAGYADIVEGEITEDWIKTNGDAETPVWAENNTDPWFVDGSRYVYGNNFGLTSDTAGTNQMPDSLHWPMYTKRAYENGAKTLGAVAIRLKIKKPGIYTPKLTFYAYNNLCKYDVFLVPASELSDTKKGYVTFGTGNDGTAALVNNVISNIDSKYHLGLFDMYLNSDTKTETTKEFDNTIEITEKQITDSNEEFYLFFRTNGSSNTEMSGTMYVNLDSFSLYTEKKEDASLDSSFTYTEEEFVGGSATLRAFAVYAEGTESEEDIIGTRSITLGETVSVSAPQSVTKGDKTYNFLYWAKGATNKKQIISYNASFTYKAYAEANNLIAVYKEKGAESTKKEYYNANGQLLENGDTLPSLPGYGKATGWQDAGNGVYVAEYAPLEKNIEITVNGETDSYAYGDTVTCTANAPEGKVFMYWTKNDEIVSTESTYTFFAWEKATVTAVYGDSAPTLGKTMRKIVLDALVSGDYTAVMAEFIGFSDAVEKGIIFGGKKIPMLTDKSQFTLTNDTENTVTVTGYAIINDNGTLKEISDGSISVD